MNKNKFYLTTPIYYVNSKPHLGTLYSTLLADVIARWKKLENKKLFFMTGTDEHGQKVAQKAQEHNQDPQTFVDSIIPQFKETWSLYDIQYDKFARTTSVEHKVAVEKWIEKLQLQSDIYKSSYSGLYCIQCETFVTHPIFKDENKKTPLCPTCNRAVEEILEENYFFRLSGYEDKLLEFYKSHPDFITPKERLNEVISFVKSGLADLSISRKAVKWGIPFPGDPSQTVYVWADALNIYISAIGYGQPGVDSKKNFEFWWPADLQIMAKDILRFHAVYWPAFLMAAGLELPKKLLVHGYILMNDEKMSKSKGNVIDPAHLAEKYGVDQVRYYLMRHISVNQDGHFSIDDLEQTISADLANNLGNLLNRSVVLALNNSLDFLPQVLDWEEKTLALHLRCEETFREYWDEMNHYQIHIGLAAVWKFISEVNAYFNDQQPWKAAKQDAEKFIETISATMHCLYAIAIMISPIMPKKSKELLELIGQGLEENKDYAQELRANKWNKIFKLTKPTAPLFDKIIKEEIKN